MDAHGILERLDGATGTGPQWSAKCPSHDDTRASLSVRNNGDRILLHCHAGCAPEDIVTAIGLDIRDLFDGPTNGNGRGEIVAAYNYIDGSGALLFQQVRFAPKDFRVRRPDGNDGWIWNLKGVPRVLYQLPAVINTVKRGGVIWIVEGERDVDRLVSLGLTATTNPGGAGKWRKHFNESLADAHVIILPDHDDTGRKHAQQVACALHGTAKSSKIVQLPDLPDKGDVSDWLDAGHDVQELFELVKAAPEYTPTNNTSEASESVDCPRRIIVDNEDALTRVTDEAIAAIHERPDFGVFIRGRQLVRVARDGTTPERWFKRWPGSPAIVKLETAHVLGVLDQAAQWMKTDRRKKCDVPREPRKAIAEQVRCRLEWPLRYLEDVIEVPTIRADGSILDTPGWDETTGLLYKELPQFKERWRGVPDRPSLDIAQNALGTLLQPVVDFPWVKATDQSAYVAAVLTLVGRHLIDGPVPMFGIRSPTPGTGKSLLADVIALIGTGRVFPSMTMTYDGEEIRKRIHALAIDGTTAVLLDNVSGSLESDALAAALTRTDWEDRVLGMSQMVRVPLRTVWFATGNNITLKRTMQRRTIPIDLDAKVETPEDRQSFVIRDLIPYIKERRVEFVTAALTILRGFIQAGRSTHGQPRMGSFEAWDDLIRSAVLWVGLEDPASTNEGEGRGRLRAQTDDEVEEAKQLLETLAEMFPKAARFTTQEVFAHLNDSGAGITERKEITVWRSLLDAVVASRKDNKATARSLGNKLREIRDRPIGGYTLRHHKRRLWSVEGT